MRTLEEAGTVTAEARDTLADVKRIVLDVCPSAKVLLYGSVSRGTQTAESDYDLLILTEQQLTDAEEEELNRRIYRLELEREVVLTSVCCSLADWESPVSRGSPFYEEVQRDAVLL